MPQSKKIKTATIPNQPHRTISNISADFLIFSVAFALFIIGPAVLGFKFAPYPLLKISDIFDLLTPLVLIPLYWLLFRSIGSGSSSFGEELAFMVFAGFWVLGQGMHLSANSIGHLAEKMAGTDIQTLTTFYDETLSHYFWHIGVMGLSLTLMYRQWQHPFSALSRTLSWQNMLACIIYGFTFFAMAVEGVTVPVALPFAFVTVAFGLVQGRKRFGQMPLLFLFLAGYIVSLVLFAIWRIWQGDFIEFSKSPDFKFLFRG